MMARGLLRVLLAWLVLLGLGPAASSSQVPSAGPDVLTNEDVLELTAASVTPAIIISRIRGSRCAFSLETPALVELKTARVDDGVVQAMLECAASSAASTRPGHEIRISILDASTGAGILLRPAHVNQGMRLGWFSWGNQIVLPGKHAAIRCPTGSPVFQFEFRDGRESPEGWILTKLESTDEGEGRRIDPDSAHAVTTEALQPGTYRVTPKKKLKRGEYALYKGQIQSGFAVPSGYPGAQPELAVYDFGLE